MNPPKIHTKSYYHIQKSGFADFKVKQLFRKTTAIFNQGVKLSKQILIFFVNFNQLYDLGKIIKTNFTIIR